MDFKKIEIHTLFLCILLNLHQETPRVDGMHFLSKNEKVSATPTPRRGRTGDLHRGVALRITSYPLFCKKRAPRKQSRCPFMLRHMGGESESQCGVSCVMEFSPGCDFVMCIRPESRWQKIICKSSPVPVYSFHISWPVSVIS